MAAAGAAVLNAVKKMAGIPDDLYLIAPNVFASMQQLGIDVTCDPEYVTANLYYA